MDLRRSPSFALTSLAMAPLIAFWTGTNSRCRAITSVHALRIAQGGLTVLPHVPLGTLTDLVVIAPSIVRALLIAFRIGSFSSRNIFKFAFFVRFQKQDTHLFIDRFPFRKIAQKFSIPKHDDYDFEYAKKVVVDFDLVAKRLKFRMRSYFGMEFRRWRNHFQRQQKRKGSKGQTTKRFLAF